MVKVVAVAKKQSPLSDVPSDIANVNFGILNTPYQHGISQVTQSLVPEIAGDYTITPCK